MKSTDIIQPTAITRPIALNGTRNSIPESPAGSNYASIEEGFPDITMISPTNGGLPPFGQDFNGLFYLSTDQKVYLQNGGTITYNEDVASAIGGYPQGAILDYVTTDGSFAKVQSLIDDNTYNFATNSDYINDEYWQLLTYYEAQDTSTIGDPIVTLSSTLNDNEIWLNGAEVSKTTYSALYSVYGDTYGTPEDEDNFILPDFRDRAVWGADDFGYLDAGLPNATGALAGAAPGGFAIWLGAGEDALYNNYSSASYSSLSTNSSFITRSSDDKVRLDLSKSNSIYGNSSTVQPPAIKVRVKTKYKI